MKNCDWYCSELLLAWCGVWNGMCYYNLVLVTDRSLGAPILLNVAPLCSCISASTFHFYPFWYSCLLCSFAFGAICFLQCPSADNLSWAWCHIQSHSPEQGTNRLACTSHHSCCSFSSLSWVLNHHFLTNSVWPMEERAKTLWTGLYLYPQAFIGLSNALLISTSS